jgi:dihydrofolate synthase/folylpolyglutamate synthase
LIPQADATLLDWLNYLGSIHVSAIDLGLERVLPVAEALQLLKPTAKVITVAGTNGKGSTTTTIASIFAETGQRVGLYQSPHIFRFNERVRINGVEVADQTLIDAFVQVEQARQACGLTLSFFEATTLAAFLIFKQQACDIWVLEIGLGGRLDVVNIIDPDVAVITNIGLDHVDWLGDTIEKIAFEKAGIMRSGIPVVYGDAQVPQAVIEQAAKLGCQLLVGGKDYSWSELDQQNAFIYAAPAITMTLNMPKLALVNICAAITAALLAEPSLTVPVIQSGVQKALIPGRFEQRYIGGRTVILDVAHNVHGAEFLLKQLTRYQHKNAPDAQIHLVFSMLSDKDIAGVVGQLSSVTDHWYIAPLDVPRAASMDQLKQALQSYAYHEYDHAAQALQQAIKHSQPQDIILVCGSFHTLEAVWESLALWQ